MVLFKHSDESYYGWCGFTIREIVYFLREGKLGVGDEFRFCGKRDRQVDEEEKQNKPKKWLRDSFSLKSSNKQWCNNKDSNNDNENENADDDDEGHGGNDDATTATSINKEMVILTILWVMTMVMILKIFSSFILKLRKNIFRESFPLVLLIYFSLCLTDYQTQKTNQ